MNKNVVIALLVVALAGLGYYVYQERQKDNSVSIQVGRDGVRIEAD